MLIRHGYNITVNCSQPTAMVAMLNIREDRLPDIRQPELFTTEPVIEHFSYHDLFGNRCRRFLAPAGDLTLRSTAILEDDGQPDAAFPDAIQHEVADLPDEALVFLMGSRYVETDRISQFAWNNFGHIQHGWARVQAVCDFVHEHIRFNYQNARNTRTAMEALEERTGVCRDFTHLAIALTRALNIPARYVNGYLGDFGVLPNGPMDFAAWMEVYLGGRWHTFDARNNIPRIGRIVIAQGRDAADVAMISSFGPHLLKSFTVIADEVTPERRVA